jgi:hypothetical protein
MQTQVELDAAREELAARPSRRRWQFSLFSLFLLTTATCLVLSWWVWPQPIEVVSIVNASTTALPVSRIPVDGGQQDVVVYQQELLRELRKPDLLKDAVSVPGNGKLRLFRDQSEPTKWLERRLRVEVVPPSTVLVSLKVPPHLHDEGVEVVDYITTKCISRTLVKVGRQTRSFLSELQAEQVNVRRKLRAATSPTSEQGEPRTLDEAEIVALQSEAAQLDLLIRKAELADNSSQYLQLVQMATAINQGQ